MQSFTADNWWLSPDELDRRKMEERHAQAQHLSKNFIVWNDWVAVKQEEETIASEGDIKGVYLMIVLSDIEL